MRLLSPMAFVTESMAAPLLPKDFTTARPRAYSMTAPVMSRLAWASTGALTRL